MTLLRWYMEVGGLMAIGYGASRLAAALRPFDPRGVLRLMHGAFALALALPLWAAWIPRAALPHPSVQVWSGRPGGAHASYALITRNALPSRGWAVSLEWAHWWPALALAALAAVAASLARHGWRLWRLRRALDAATEIRRIGRVSVRISDTEPVPYSAWWLGRAYAVLPLALLADRRGYGIALRHELQHHRQGDTLRVHLIEICRALFFWNPAAHGWARLTEQLQELACDEILIGRKVVSPQAYGSCLFKVAQQALGSSAVLAGTTGMAAGRSGRFFRRRIEMLFVADRKKSSWLSSAFFALGTLAAMAGTTYAASGLIQDRRLTMEEARALVARTPGSEIPITLNERVLRRLNQYVGTPEGREAVRAGMSRMPLYKSMIERKISAQGFPAELLAMPLQESGFRNDVISPKPYRARGIWQFIQPTALNYGLTIDEHVDERLDPEKETDAAMSYLKDLMAQFGDWRLALKGYNEGEKRVQALIDQYHTRDPWVLEGISSSEDYLAGTMAMMIILKNPGLVD